MEEQNLITKQLAELEKEHNEMFKLFTENINKFQEKFVCIHININIKYTSESRVALHIVWLYLKLISNKTHCDQTIFFISNDYRMSVKNQTTFLMKRRS